MKKILLLILIVLIIGGAAGVYFLNPFTSDSSIANLLIRVMGNVSESNVVFGDSINVDTPDEN